MKETVGFYSKPAKSQSGSFLDTLSRKKPVEKSLAEATSQKTLQWYDLTAYGIAATVGSGIYATVGRVARDQAGPSVIFSTLIAGLLSFLTGICYLEFASALPISGSGYAYFYALMGEFLGWFIGWNLTLEYGFAAALISEVWAKYLVSLFKVVGVKVPSWLYNYVPTDSIDMLRINIIAGLVVLFLGFVVSRGAKFGTMLTNSITVLNITIILFIIVVGSLYVTPSNWAPFMPNFPGIFTGGGQMFFSFIGYDTVSTLAAEAVNPSRDIPVAIMLTLGVATGLYMLVGLVITGMVPFAKLDEHNSLTEAFVAVNARGASHVITVAALLMMAATMFACLAGQPKIFQAIAKDGLMPSAFARENSSGTPTFSIAASTILLAMVATFIKGDSIGDMVTFGTLFAMSTLCAGVMIVRFNGFEEKKKIGSAASVSFLFGSLIASWMVHNFSSTLGLSSVLVGVIAPLLVLSYYFIRYSKYLQSKSTAFSCPLMPVIPCLAIASNSYIMMSLPSLSTILFQFSIWTATGFAIYFGYGISHSHLGKTNIHKA